MSTVAQYTPIQARSRGVVHATSLASPDHTACGRRCEKWVVALGVVDCRACGLALFYPCLDEPRKKRAPRPRRKRGS